MNSDDARERLAAHIARRNEERGRPLTDHEKLQNLFRALDRICPECGDEVEPGAACACGWMRPETVSRELLKRMARKAD